MLNLVVKIITEKTKKIKKIMIIKREKLEDCKTWEEIFDYQSRKDGANYTLLKAWLIKNFNFPVQINKNNEKQS